MTNYVKRKKAKSKMVKLLIILS